MATVPNPLHHHGVSSVDHRTDPEIPAESLATQGWCQHCRETGIVGRYRIRFLGLRWIHARCADRLTAMGMRVDLVGEHEPRKRDRRGWLRWPGVVA